MKNKNKDINSLEAMLSITLLALVIVVIIGITWLVVNLVIFFSSIIAAIALIVIFLVALAKVIYDFFIYVKNIFKGDDNGNCNTIQ